VGFLFFRAKEKGEVDKPPERARNCKKKLNLIAQLFNLLYYQHQTICKVIAKKNNF